VIRVLLAEDHGLVRAGLERLLTTTADIEVVDAAADGAEAIELVAETQPDVVLMDLSMPNVDAIEAADRRHRPDAGRALVQAPAVGLRTARPEACSPRSPLRSFAQKETAARQVSPPCRALAEATMRVVRDPAASRRRSSNDPLGRHGRADAPEGRRAVADERHAPSLADAILIDLELSVDPAVVGLGLQLPCARGGARSALDDAVVALASAGER